jgi:hypothetical protein
MSAHVPRSKVAVKITKNLDVRGLCYIESRTEGRGGIVSQWKALAFPDFVTWKQLREMDYTQPVETGLL